MPGELTDDERLILDIAGRHYKYSSSRDQAARDELGITAIRYSQRLNALVERPEAMAYAPVTCRLIRDRIQRGRDRRRSAH